MKRHQQQQPQAGGDSATTNSSRSAPQSSQPEPEQPPLQFDSNMDWPASEAEQAEASSASEARDPLPFPTAHIAPCARITTRIYHPPHLTQAGLISGAAGSGGMNAGGAGGGGLYAQQAQQGRVETVRDVLVEIAGPSRDDMGRPIIALAPPPPPAVLVSVAPVVPVQAPTNPAQANSSTLPTQRLAVAQRVGGRTTLHTNPTTAIAAVGTTGTAAVAAIAVDDDDTGAGFTGAGSFLLGGMATSNAVSVTPGNGGGGIGDGGHGSGGSNLMAAGNMVTGTTGAGGAANANGGGMADGDGDGDDSMSSGWSTSDSEMSYDNANTGGGRGNVNMNMAGGGGGGPTRPNPSFAGGGGGGATAAAANAGTAGHHHHHHQEYQPPQRAYLLQRTLREAIYGRVRYGIVLKRRQLPPDYDNATNGNGGQQQPMAEWEVTEERCAVKEMSWQHIRKERNRLAEDPIKEVSAMQYLKRYLAHCNGSATSLDSSDAMLSTHLMLPLDLLSDDRYLYSVMPYCDGGELFDRLDQRQKFSEDEARYWMHQILEGLDNLQRAGICHRDMSLENLLVHKDRICLVIDMGMCLRIPYEGSKEDGSDLFDVDGGDGEHDDSKRPRSLSTGNELRQSFMGMDLDNGAAVAANGVAGNAGHRASSDPTSSAGNAAKKCCLDIRERQRYLMKPQGTCGKWHYMASEIMKNKDPFDGHAVDMWAVGVIMFLMLTGFPPWERACRTDERFRYMSAGYLVQMLTEWDLGLSPDAMDLLQRMVWIDPRDRLSLAQVRNHPWMLTTNSR
mmetsp:Transcript_7887/g.21916  ORF Transcript_7887/g.21916 Transcript_7887/m.21916 type:complete len:787 (+) Transcript_7887:415-2775(+)